MPRSTGVQFLSLQGTDAWRYVLIALNLFAAFFVSVAVAWCLLVGTRFTPIMKQALIAYWLMLLAVVVSTVFNPNAELSRGLFLPGMFMWAVLAFGRTADEDVLDVANIGLIFIMATSLLTAVFFPQWAFVEGPTILGLHLGRLAGLSTHPNTIGALAVLALVIPFWYPIGRARRLALLCTATPVLVLSQSKTAWVAAGVAITILVTYKIFRHWRRQTRVAMAFLAVMGSCVSLMLLVWGGVITVEQEVARSLTTFTGRTYLWGIAFEKWTQAPWIGYGSEAWSEDWRAITGMPWAGHAHNQLLDMLNRAGAVGTSAMVAYVLILIRAALLKSESSNGASLAAVAIILIRATMETPFRNTVLDQSFLLHMLVLMLLVLPGKDFSAAQSKQARTRIRHMTYSAAGALGSDNGCKKPRRNAASVK